MKTLPHRNIRVDHVIINRDQTDTIPTGHYSLKLTDVVCKVHDGNYILTYYYQLPY